jgi:hypothetical protein
MDIGARLHVCGIFLMFVLTFAVGLCCGWFMYPIWCWCLCSEVGNSSIDWGQLNRFLPEYGDIIQSPKLYVLNKAG